MQDIFSFAQQHAFLSTALIGVLILLIIIELIKQKKGATGLSPAQATQFINHKDAVVVDIRDKDAYNAGHVIGALSIPIKDFETRLKKEKSKNQPIILVCALGQESVKHCNELQKNGYLIYTLAGGMRAWKEAGMPVVKA